ncbi:MAG TPA: hypothetical protein VME69_13145 [Methylocella sp.]|nr:hypothetical protein [Methylocella sp.]
MNWRYRGLSEFDPLVIDYRSGIDARAAKVRTGEQQQRIETEIDDLLEILEAAKQCAIEKRDPCEVMEPLRLNGQIREGYYILHRQMNGCKIVYRRDVLDTSAVPVFIYCVDHPRTETANRLLELLGPDNQ